eukprot:scaffold774_cov248-Pinguiococcus_pyrenoidosus.AAC.21
MSLISFDPYERRRFQRKPCAHPVDTGVLACRVIHEASERKACKKELSAPRDAWDARSTQLCCCRERQSGAAFSPESPH